MTHCTYSETFLSDAAVLSMLAVIHDEASRAGHAISIAITDHHGGLQGFLRLNNASFTCRTIAINKATTAAGLNLTTAKLGEIMSEHNLPASHYGDERITGFGGGLPIEIGGKVVGGIGVSGLTDEQDIYYAKLAMQTLNTPQ